MWESDTKTKSPTEQVAAAAPGLLAELRSLAESMERTVRIAHGDALNPAQDISRQQVSMWAASARAAIARAAKRD